MAKTVLITDTSRGFGKGATIPFTGLYGATKHAVEAMTDSGRYELSQLGVDVVLVQPSAYPTHMCARLPPADMTHDARAGVRFGR
jgi:NAD(P)-dependent dehydrogenase (short-subunit alcohol dehydrogenase family)